VAEPQGFAVQLDCLRRRARLGHGDQPAERGQVEDIRAGRQPVAIALTYQIRPGRSCRQVGLQQPPQRTRIFLDNVHRRRRRLGLPQQVDHITRADRAVVLREQQA
jgi:hypothetical protein